MGGGQGAFIGRVHATAAILDNRAVLVAGALSSDPEKAKASAPSYDIPADRAYGSFEELIEKERALPADRRIDFISIATPNHTHFPIAKKAVEAGFNVICDKPMTFNLYEAEDLAATVEKSGVVFALTHNYTGYPLMREARQMILSGELGEIQAIRSNYLQGWLRSRIESAGQKQASWRTDPMKSGAAGSFGDLGTHAFNLARYLTGLIAGRVSCTLKIFAPGRQLDDYGHAVIRYENGALGTVTISQITHGRENDHTIEVDGTKGAIAWRQEDPNQMTFRRNGQPHAIYTRDPERPAYKRSGQGRLPHSRPAIRKGFSRRSPTSTVRRLTRSSSGPPAKSSSPATRSIQTFTTASKGCISSSNASPRARRTPPGCRSSTAWPAAESQSTRGDWQLYEPRVFRRPVSGSRQTRRAKPAELASIVLPPTSSRPLQPVIPARRSRRVVPRSDSDRDVLRQSVPAAAGRWESLHDDALLPARTSGFATSAGNSPTRPAGN